MPPQTLTYKPTGHWSTSDRAYKLLLESLTYQKEVIQKMVDLSTKTIKNLFEQQIQRLTLETVGAKAATFDYQMSGGWIR
jgi:hypothetical protein